MSVERQLHKFGGSSLANPECYRRVVNILKEYSQQDDLIVVSAAGKTTNKLIEFIDGLHKDGRLAHEALQELKKFQTDLIEQLLDDESKEPLLAQLNDEFKLLGELTAPLSETEQACVLGHGESWSSRLLAALLNQNKLPSRTQDSRVFLRAEAGTQPEVDRGASYPLLKEVLAQHAHHRVVITGFMAQDKQGKTVLLGRNGSDYSATVIGALAQVSRVTIWSDVAGVYSADPRLVADACLLHCCALMKPVNLLVLLRLYCIAAPYSLSHKAPWIVICVAVTSLNPARRALNVCWLLVAVRKLFPHLMKC
ncbi:aspartokinase [Vibrio ponticus]|nr:aspartokinase [Vibrio ponticus]